MIRIGNIDARQVRICIPSIGAWLVDVDVDIPSDQPIPTGKQTLTIGTAQLQGTVIDEGTGRFGESARVRLLGGAAAWGTVLEKGAHWHNDAPAGVLSSVVTQAVAAAIGETVNDSSPISYGVDFERVGGLPASSVLEGRIWRVDADGITQISPWPSLTMGADASVLFYSETDRVADMAADEIVWPGTILEDARFGPVTVCEVDQAFTAKGSRVTAYCASSLADRFGDAFAAVAGLNDPAFERIYWYRVSTQGTDGRLRLQAMTKASGIPDTLPLRVWPGIPGASAKYKLGSQVAVYFLNGDRTQPRVFSFDGTSPVELTLDAETKIILGKNASDFVALEAKVKANFDAFNTALVSTGLPVAGGGGGTAKLANPVALQAMGAEKVQAE